MELLISYGTSKGGSAGHLALAIRDQAPGDDLVYSANFYADRSREHENDFYTDDLMVGIPKKEYLFGTRSSLGDKASFGLDFGEIYKRSVIGVRVYGVPAAEKQRAGGVLQAHQRRLSPSGSRHRVPRRRDHGTTTCASNCAKTIGAGFRFGAGYQDLEVTSATILSRRRLVAAANANIPTEMAMKLLEAWNARGYGLDVVLYKKYGARAAMDPGREGGVQGPAEPISFGHVARLSPGAGSLRGRRQPLSRCTCFTTWRKYSVRVNDDDEAARDRQEQEPDGLQRGRGAAARRDAAVDSENYARGSPVKTRGTGVERALRTTRA